jgi:type I restriction enzyme, S subunit
MAVWSEVDFGDVCYTMRYDAEFYRPEYLHYASLVSKGDILSDCVKISHPAEVTRIYEESGIRILLAQNVRANWLDFNIAAYMPLSVEKVLRRNLLEIDDVVMTRSGANFGDTAVYKGSSEPVYACADVLIIKPKGIAGGYISTYFNTEIGRALLTRGAYGAAQPHIAPNYLNEMFLPRIGIENERQIDSLVIAAITKNEESKMLYAEAEALLLHELGLDALTMSEEVTYERNFDEVARAGRIDAEYFHPEKKEVQDALAKMTGQTVGEHFSVANDLINPQSKENQKKKDVKVQNYDLDESLQFFLDDIEQMNLVDLGSAKKAFQKGDVVVSRLRSYLKEIAIVKSSNYCVGSSEYIVLRNNDSIVSPELLTVYLRSSAVQTILKWSQDGSNHPRFKETELLAIKIPDKLISIQDKIIELLKDSIDSITQAKQLLEDAKQRVEDMILGA